MLLALLLSLALHLPRERGMPTLLLLLTAAVAATTAATLVMSTYPQSVRLVAAGPGETYNDLSIPSRLGFPDRALAPIDSLNTVEAEWESGFALKDFTFQNQARS